MPKFRKKPIVIEAEQYFYDQSPWPKGVIARGLGAFINTLEGPLNVSEGDWIIKGVQGEFYPCKPDIFEATYEEITDGS